MLNGFMLIIALIYIIGIGFCTLAINNNFLKDQNILIIPAISWLTGCVAITVSYTIWLLVDLAGAQFYFLPVILMPIVVLTYFYPKIRFNIYEFYMTQKSKWPDYSTSRMPYPMLLLILLVFFVLFFVLSAVKPAWAWDAWMIWTMKAKMLYFNTFDVNYLTNKQYAYTHQEYPLLVPMMQAFLAKFSGVFDARLTQVFFSMTYMSFVLILYSFARKFLNLLLTLLFIMAVSAIPVLFVNIHGAYADAVLATFLSMAIYYLYTYFKTSCIYQYKLMPVIIALSGMLLTKNEGLLLALSLFITCIIYRYTLESNATKQYKKVLFCFGIALLFYMPWLITTKLLGLSNDVISISTIFTVQTINHITRLPDILSFMLLDNMFNISQWGLLFYIFLIYALIGLHKKFRSELLLFTVPFLFCFASYTVIYVITPHELKAHLVSSGFRVLLTICPFAIFYILSVLNPDTYQNKGS
jgi:hypothetical protein